MQIEQQAALEARAEVRAVDTAARRALKLARAAAAASSDRCGEDGANCVDGATGEGASGDIVSQLLAACAELDGQLGGGATEGGVRLQYNSAAMLRREEELESGYRARLARGFGTESGGDDGSDGGDGGDDGGARDGGEHADDDRAEGGGVLRWGEILRPRELLRRADRRV